MGADIHQHLVEQHQGREIVLLRFRQQLYHERFRRGGVALGVFAVGVDEFEAV